MCTNCRFIHNPYDGKKYLVSCGHCEACLSEKSLRHVSRIKCEQLSGSYLGVFVTLHYENRYVPYVLKSEVDAFCNSPLENSISVYRNNQIITTYDYDDISLRTSDLRWLNTDFHFLRKKLHNGRYVVYNDKVAVIYLRDIQLFLKRLRQKLVRSGYKGKFSYYYASEYGSEFNRCHFHILFFIDKGYYEMFRRLLASCWSYANLFRCFKNGESVRQSIEIAKNPAKYVASYINCRSYVPSFLSEVKQFRPFTHFSNGFGCNFSEFLLPSLLQKIEERNLRYSYKTIKNGISTVSVSRIPKYVLHRYFPKFKGYRYLLSDEIFEFVRRPLKLFSSKELRLRYKAKDLLQVYRTLKNLCARILSLGVSLFDWSVAYSKVWQIFASNSLVDSFEDVHSKYDMSFHYDNIIDYYNGDVSNLYLDSISSSLLPIEDPNDFPVRKASTDRLVFNFKNAVKHHRVKSYYYETKSNF